MHDAAPMPQLDLPDDLCREIDAWVGPRCIYPISLGIPSHLVQANVPAKDRDFATDTSQGTASYQFQSDQQSAYYADYQRSWLGLSCRKGGWDCMRHLEIMANGCLPYFQGGNDIPRFTMTHYPKDVIRKTLQAADNVTLRSRSLVYKNDEQPLASKPAELSALAKRMLGHLKVHSTTQAIASYLLRQMGKPDAKSVLFLSSGKKIDYACDLLFHGLRELLGAGCVDHGKLWWMYNSATPQQRANMYGRGFTYSGHLDDIDINRTDIRKRIQQREFDLVVFGSATRHCDMLPYVRQYYDHDEVALIDGEDYCRLTGWTKQYEPNMGLLARRRMKPTQLPYLGVYFKRELDDAVILDYARSAPTQ